MLTVKTPKISKCQWNLQHAMRRYRMYSRKWETAGRKTKYVNPIKLPPCRNKIQL